MTRAEKGEAEEEASFFSQNSKHLYNSPVSAPQSMLPLPPYPIHAMPRRAPHRCIHPTTTPYSRLLNPLLLPLNLANDIIALAEEGEPLSQHGLVLFLEIAPLGHAVLGFEGGGRQRAGRVFACEYCVGWGGTSVRTSRVGHGGCVCLFNLPWGLR